MENNSALYEVLLVTGSRFAARQYAEKDTSENTNKLSGNEKLKDACWNGLLREMLPEIFQVNPLSSKLYLWQVREANRFLALEMSEHPIGVNKYLSIDPYRFLDVKQYN